MSNAVEVVARLATPRFRSTDTMAVRRPETVSPPTVVAVVGCRDAAVPAASATDFSHKRNYSETVDSDVDENTKDTITSMDRFTKYVDCQETLVELSFIKWMSGFRLECRRLASNFDKDLYFGLLNFVHVNIAPEIVDCRNKANKSTLLKSYLEQVLLYFRKYHKDRQMGAYDAIYYDKMSSLLAYYIDLKLMASQRFKENSWYRKISSKINASISIFLDENIDYMFDSIFQLYYVFYGSLDVVSIGSIMLPVVKKLLVERPIPKKLKFLTYLRYILCFKLWKKIVLSLATVGFNKRKELEQIRLLMRALNPPLDFIAQHEKYNWPNWPKLTISPNGTPAMIERDLKNVAFVLYKSKTPIKEFFKDILEASRKDIPILMKSVDEQCQILRPDLYAVGGKQVLEAWELDFDRVLKPLIPTTRSCNSLIRKIKYNLFKDMVVKSDVSEQNVCNTNCVVSNVNNNHKDTTNSGESSENHTLQYKENVISKSDADKTDHLNMSRSKTSDGNEQSIRVSKSVFANGTESFPVIHVKQQSNEDILQVNAKISKSYKNEDSHHLHHHHHHHHRFDTSLSSLSTNNIESTVHHHGHGSYSSSKGTKRTHHQHQSTVPFCDNESSKRFCRTKARHEKSAVSDCLNQGHENIVCVDNGINGVVSRSRVIETSVRENKWVIKPYPESMSSVASPINMKRAHFSNRDEQIEILRATELLHSDQDDVASPSSDVLQWSMKSPCDIGSPESKPTGGNNSDQTMEIEMTSSDTEGGNNSPKTEHILSLRSSEEMISKLVCSRRVVNENNENTQIYALPMDQKLTHVEHPYVENAVNSSTRDLEVVNVLSPVSINSTDIPMNKSSWVSDVSSALAQNDHNDADGDHSQSSCAQQHLLCSNSINANAACNSSRAGGTGGGNHSHNNSVGDVMVEHLGHAQSSGNYNRTEPRMYPTDDSNSATVSPNEAYSGDGSSVNQIQPQLTVVKSSSSVPVTGSPATDVVIMHELNDSSTYRTISFKGNNKSSTEPSPPQSSYSFTMSKRPTTMTSIMVLADNALSGNKNNVPDEFSDVDSMDLRINNISNVMEPCKDAAGGSCSNGLLMDLKSMNALNNSFDKSGDGGNGWPSAIKKPLSETTSSNLLQQKQTLKLYADPSELLISSGGPVNLNTQSSAAVAGMAINMNEARKMFLGNKSPSQVYYNPLADFRVSATDDRPKQNRLKNNRTTTARGDKKTAAAYMQQQCSVLQPIDDTGTIQTLIGAGYDGMLSPNSPMGVVYGSTVVYDNPLQLQQQHKNSDCLSPYSNFDQMTAGPSLLQDDPNVGSKDEQQNVINMAQLMLQANKNCKVHYKWPLTKNKSQTTTAVCSSSNGGEALRETSSQRNATNVLYSYTDEELNPSGTARLSPNDMSPNQQNAVIGQSNQQFQDISNLIASADHSGSNAADEKNPLPIDHHHHHQQQQQQQQETMYRNTKMSNQSQETSTTLSREVFEAARYLFNKGKLLLCMYPKCINGHHFRVIPSNAEMLRHEFTVPFDDFRFNIQYKYKQLLTSNPRTWPSVPELVQLSKRCLCEICGDFDSKLNQNQDMLHTYVDGKKPNVEEDNDENEQPINPKIRLSWKKNLAKRFSSEAIAKQSISQMIEDMESHINRFARAFTIIFPLVKDVKKSTQNLQNACNSYPEDAADVSSLNSECATKLDIAHTHFINDLHIHSYQYLQLPKVIPKYVLEELSNSSYQQPPNQQNGLNTLHQFDEEHLPNEINRYFAGTCPSPSSYQSSNNPTLTANNNKNNNNNTTSHQPPPLALQVDNSSPSTSRQSSSSVGPSNLLITTSSTHQPVLTNFTTTLHHDSCSLLNDRVAAPPKHNHMSHYSPYSDGQQIYTEFPSSHTTYLQVPRGQFPNPSLATCNSYYGSSIHMPSNNNPIPSVPSFCSAVASSVQADSPSSSDCSIPSLVETVATAMPEHALLDDSLEAVNAAHNLMLISNRHRYNSTTPATTGVTTDAVVTVATANTATVTNDANTSITSCISNHIHNISTTTDAVTTTIVPTNLTSVSQTQTTTTITTIITTSTNTATTTFTTTNTNTKTASTTTANNNNNYYNNYNNTNTYTNTNDNNNKNSNNNNNKLSTTDDTSDNVQFSVTDPDEDQETDGIHNSRRKKKKKHDKKKDKKKKGKR